MRVRVTARDLSHLTVRRFTVSDICSAFGVRLADIKHVRRRASRAPGWADGVDSKHRTAA